MAVIVTGNKGMYDCFETKCPHCGRTLKYSRNSVRAHYRWPNGFIYCPGCRRPVGHDEANIVSRGDKILKEAAIQEGLTKEKLEKQVEELRVPKNVLLGIGIPLLVLGAIFTTMSLFVPKVIWWFIPFAVFNVGLSMTILGGVFSRMINHKLLTIDSL